MVVAVAVREEVRQRFVAIRTAAGELVTVIELLSPNHKRPGWPPCDRSVRVIRRHRAHAGEQYPFSIDDPLPTIALPLREPDEDYPLQLQAVLEDLWRRGNYDHVLAHLRRQGEQR